MTARTPALILLLVTVPNAPFALAGATGRTVPHAASAAWRAKASTSTAGTDSLRPRAAAVRTSWSVLRKDSLTYLPYNDAGDVAGLFPGMARYDLGLFGQPQWISASGSAPLGSALLLDGKPMRDPVAGLADPLAIPVEDADRVILYPAHQAFWYAGNGATSAVDFVTGRRSAPHPYTRIRHREGPFDYLFTDAVFSVDPGPSQNLTIGIERPSIGQTGTDNVARFASTRAEIWNLRGRYDADLSRRVSLTISERYSDQLVYLNGGVQGWSEAGLLAPMLYPPASASSYTDTAFNPITAQLLNPTMRTKTTRNDIAASAAVTWDDAGTQKTAVSLSHMVRERRFSDDLARVSRDTIYLADPLSTTAVRIEYGAAVAHSIALDGFSVDADGRIAYGITPDPEAVVGRKAWFWALRGRAAASLGIATLTALGRYQYGVGQHTFGGGATLELPLGPLDAWGGVSWSQRPYTYFERAYAAPDIVRSSSTATLPPEDVVIADAGISWTSPAARAHLRVFASSAKRMLRLTETAWAPSQDWGGYRFFSVLNVGAYDERLAGASLGATLLLWRFALEGMVNGATTTALSPELAGRRAPQYDARLSAYYRGALIEGTLVIKAGADASFRSAFTPLVYNPAWNIFGLQAGGRGESYSTAYTSRTSVRLFLFATVKDAATIHLTWDNLLGQNFVDTQFYPAEGSAIRFGVDWVLFD